MRRGMEDGHSHAPHDSPCPSSSSPMLSSSLRARKALQDEGRQNGTYQPDHQKMDGNFLSLQRYGLPRPPGDSRSCF